VSQNYLFIAILCQKISSACKALHQYIDNLIEAKESMALASGSGMIHRMGETFSSARKSWSGFSGMSCEDVRALAEVHRQADRRRWSVLQDERRQIVCVLKIKTKHTFKLCASMSLVYSCFELMMSDSSWEMIHIVLILSILLGLSTECHGFRSMKPDDYFSIDFDHF